MLVMSNLKKITTFKKTAPDAMASFLAFDKAAHEEGAISKKNKELMAIAVALTTQCSYCIEVHRKAAVDAGASEKELAEVTFVTAALRAGAALTHGTHLVHD
jgi:AhpD family alkylhydroperoxidase